MALQCEAYFVTGRNCRIFITERIEKKRLILNMKFIKQSGDKITLTPPPYWEFNKIVSETAVLH